MRVAAHHIESLDVFRGITIAAMMLVNNPGDWGAVFPPLLHTYWTGCTFADLVFPWFIFIMGFALPFAFARRRHERGHQIRHLHGRIAQRVVWLIALGLFLNAVAAWPEVWPLRFPGVLQRIALSYLVAGLVVLHLDVRGWIVTAGVLLLGHWALLALVPFGGVSAGTMTPDDNLARYLDTAVFGSHVLMPTDPEGLLGTLSASATAILGALAGELTRRTDDDVARVRSLVSVGAVTFAAGLVWSMVLPVSKPLWTGSYVLLATGLAMLVLVVIYVIVDLWQVRGWARPFLWLGVNPLAVYFFSEVVGHLIDRVWTGETTPKAWFFWNWLEPALRWWPPEWASLVFGLAFVTAWTAVAGMLYHRRIRIQV